MLMRTTRRRVAPMLLAFSLSIGTGHPPRAAELFYMDHDTLTAQYVGAVGPLVLSGDIAAGDYDRLLTTIAQSEARFLRQNILIVASEEGDVAESLRIGVLMKALLSEIVVDPQVGRCSGACFLIYAAAARRETNGPGLLGVRRLPAVDAFLRENAVPDAVMAELHGHATDVYWLSAQDEESLGGRSPAFARYLQTKCSWDETVERAVLSGKRAMSELRPLLDCRNRVTRIDAHKALAGALAARAAAR
jgi:hypothetical protein